MNLRTHFHAGTLAALATATLLAAGCAGVPPAGELVAAPNGTVITYQRKSTGSFGTLQGTVVWTQAELQWQGRPVVALVSPQAGTALHEPASHGLLATMNTAGRTTGTYDPPLAYAWPVTVGKTWTSRHQAFSAAAGGSTTLAMRYEVQALEDVTVPAGTFKAYLIVSTDNFGEVQRVWTSPALGNLTVKRILDRPPGHPLGAGHLEGELTARKLPG